MLKMSRIIIGIIVVMISCYGLFTQNFKMQPYMVLFLSLLMLIIGLEEFQKGKKGYASINIGIFVLLLVASFLGFLMG